MRVLAVIAALLLLVSAAVAQRLIDQRLYVPGANDMGGTGRNQVLNNNTGGTPPPPIGCTGVIDLSDGCPQAMLR
jgi:hypothetical protein